MRFNMREDSKGLCYSCRYSTIMTDQKDRERVFCSEIGGHMGGEQLPCAMKTCNSYQPTTGMTEYEAKERGWVLEVKAGKVIGFKPPARRGEE